MHMSTKQVPARIAPMWVNILPGRGEYTCRSNITIPTPAHPEINNIRFNHTGFSSLHEDYTSF